MTRAIRSVLAAAVIPLRLTSKRTSTGEALIPIRAIRRMSNTRWTLSSTANAVRGTRCGDSLFMEIGCDIRGRLPVCGSWERTQSLDFTEREAGEGKAAALTEHSAHSPSS